jgi:calcineurin-like phosphoesterase family protein
MMETHDVVAVHSPTHSTDDDESYMMDFPRQTYESALIHLHLHGKNSPETTERIPVIIAPTTTQPIAC